MRYAHYTTENGKRLQKISGYPHMPGLPRDNLEIYVLITNNVLDIGLSTIYWVAWCPWHHILPNRNEIYYKCLIEERSGQFYKVLMDGVGEVGVASRAVIEGYNETVGEALLQVFAADVFA